MAKDYTKLDKEKLVKEAIKRSFDANEVEAMDEVALRDLLVRDDSGEFDVEGVEEGAVVADAGEEFPVEVEVEVSDDAPVADKTVKHVDVLKNHGGSFTYVRSYDSKNHGKDYQKMAESFAKKNPEYVVVDGAKVTKLFVNYNEMVKSPSGEASRKTISVEFGGSLAQKGDAVKLRNMKNKADAPATISLPASFKL